MTLNEVMTQTADAIREKTGKSEKIAPVNFAEEIKSISAGGGESGGSTIEYLDVSGVENKTVYVMTATLVKVNGEVMPSGLLAEYAIDGVDAYLSVVSTINQIAIDGTLEVDKGRGKVTLKHFLEGLDYGYDSLPRLTKEQFYDLNA